MKVVHRGMTIDLPDDDPRVVIFEAVLFGRTLPPPIAVDTGTRGDLPKVEITYAMRRFWDGLRRIDRKELALLTHRMHRPAELEQALGVKQKQLAGMHSAIARRARAHRVPAPIVTKGRVRGDRRYALREDVEPWISALAAER